MTTVAINNTPVVISGSTAGVVNIYNPIAETGLNITILQFIGFSDAGGSITLPTAYASVPCIVGENAAITIPSISTSTITTPTLLGFDGTIVLIGV